jgi:hypothetical protein
MVATIRPSLVTLLPVREQCSHHRTDVPTPRQGRLIAHLKGVPALDEVRAGRAQREGTGSGVAVGVAGVGEEVAGATPTADQSGGGGRQAAARPEHGP